MIGLPSPMVGTRQLRDSLPIEQIQEACMPTPHYFRSETLVALAPWIASAAACVLALVLLSQFIDTLHGQIQRGQALRAGESTLDVRQSGVQDRVVDARTQLAGIQP